jgi:hypothetical protein
MRVVPHELRLVTRAIVVSKASKSSNRASGQSTVTAKFGSNCVSNAILPHFAVMLQLLIGVLHHG